VALVALLNNAYTLRYPILFLSDESGDFTIFSQTRLPWQRPLRYRKKRSRSINRLHPKHFHSVNIAKIRPADPEIICLREIVKDKKSKKKTRNAWQSLASSLLGAAVSPPSK